MTLQLALDEFLFQKRLSGLAGSSIGDYQIIIGVFVRTIGEDLSIQNLTYNMTTEYILTLFDRNLSRATIATYVRNIRIFLRWVYAEYDLSFDPVKLKVPKTPKKVVHIYSSVEIKTIFSEVKTTIPWITARNCAMIALMLDSGLRQGEVCTLLRKNIDTERMIMKVTGKGAKDRFVPLGQFSYSLLQNYQACCPYENDYVFLDRLGKPVSRNAVRLFVYRLKKKVPFDLTSHKLRHNFATNFCIDHVKKTGNTDVYDLSIIMGHESIETTKKYEHFAHELLALENNISHLDDVYKVQ